MEKENLMIKEIIDDHSIGWSCLETNNFYSTNLASSLSIGIDNLSTRASAEWAYLLEEKDLV